MISKLLLSSWLQQERLQHTSLLFQKQMDMSAVCLKKHILQRIQLALITLRVFKCQTSAVNCQRADVRLTRCPPTFGSLKAEALVLEPRDCQANAGSWEPQANKGDYSSKPNQHEESNNAQRGWTVRPVGRRRMRSETQAGNQCLRQVQVSTSSLQPLPWETPSTN